MTITHTLIAVVFGACVMAQSLTAQTLICETTSRSNRGPVAERILLDLDTATSVARVRDEFTQQLGPNPIPAVLRRNGRNKFIITWELNGIDYQGAEYWVMNGTVKYRLSFRSDTMKVSLTGSDFNYHSYIHGAGRCSRTAS